MNFHNYEKVSELYNKIKNKELYSDVVNIYNHYINLAKNYKEYQLMQSLLDKDGYKKKMECYGFPVQ